MSQHDEIEILLVEDNADDVELCLHALRKEKLSNKIHVARDGQEALDFVFALAHRAPESLPRLILLDLKLPKVDGIQVLRQLKQDPLTRCLPVVILTSSREERDLVDSYQLGVNSYLQKPVDFDQFRAMVKQMGFYWMVVNQVAPNGRGREARMA
jgi:two-component system, response regulator